MTPARTFENASDDLLLLWVEQGNKTYSARIKLVKRNLPEICQICLTNQDGTLEYVVVACQAPKDEDLPDGIYYYRCDAHGKFVREQDLFATILSLKVLPAKVLCKRVFGEVWKITDEKNSFSKLIGRTPNDSHLKRDKTPQEFHTQTLGGGKR
ncbi:MAG: hypothetical protein WC663_06290 [Patescibacteria group bacterium]|jgi:hypothetical protein